MLPRTWKVDLLGAVAYGVSFIFVAGICFYLRFGFETPTQAHPVLEPGQSVVIDGFTVKRIN